MKLRHLDLFSGIGGFSLGMEATGGFETVAFCEIEEYPRKVLQKHWPYVKQYKDIKELTYEKLKADGLVPIDIITGGYPCQPFSQAGKRAGEQDPRHLWPEMFRIIKELRPTWVVAENVSGHIKLGLDSVLSDLALQGYAARTFSLSASSVGANHKRERIWIVAHSERDDNFNKEQRVDGEEKEVPRERGENDSAPRESGRASTVRETNNGDVANTENIGSVPSLHEKEREGNSPRRSEGESKGSSVVADSSTFRSPGESKRDFGSMGKESQGEEKTRNKSTIRSSSCGSEESRSDVADTLKGNVQAGRERRREIRQGHQEEGIPGNASGSRETLSDSESIRHGGGSGQERGTDQGELQQKKQKGREMGSETERCSSPFRETKNWWAVEPDVGRVDHGVPDRIHRLKALGNSLIPQLPFYLGQSILKTYSKDEDEKTD
jgi:DNA-cytosine methyltransferase